MNKSGLEERRMTSCGSEYEPISIYSDGVDIIARVDYSNKGCDFGVTSLPFLSLAAIRVQATNLACKYPTALYIGGVYIMLHIKYYAPKCSLSIK